VAESNFGFELRDDWYFPVYGEQRCANSKILSEKSDDGEAQGDTAHRDRATMSISLFDRSQY